jgi:hypothetical protein
MNYLCSRNFESIYKKYDWTHCFDSCKEYISIDPMLEDTIRILNRKGYKTNFCCSGHLDYTPQMGISVYISFEKHIQLPSIPKGFTFQKECNNIFIIPKCFKTRVINIKDNDFINIFKVIRRSLVIYILNKRLYNWATKLPDLNPISPIPCTK